MGDKTMADMTGGQTNATRAPASLIIAYCDDSYKGSPNTDPLLLAASIRRFGGSFWTVPIWLMCRDTGRVQAQVLERAAALHVDLHAYTAAPDLSDFPFTEKALAAAEAERLAEGKAQELLWFDRDSLVLNDISPLRLSIGKKVSFRPVNVQNIGEDAGAGQEDDHNGFWRRARELASLGSRDIGTTTSYIDRKVLRFYIAAGLVGARPQLGIFREWERLVRLFAEDGCMRQYCWEHALYRIFLHQAALSLAVAGKTMAEERQELSALAMYPLNFWEDDPNASRPAALDDLMSLRYDTVLDDENWRRFPMSTPLRDWLQDNIR